MLNNLRMSKKSSTFVSSKKQSLTNKNYTMQLEIDFKKEELKQELNSFFNNIYSILICMQIIAGK